MSHSPFRGQGLETNLEVVDIELKALELPPESDFFKWEARTTVSRQIFFDTGKQLIPHC